MSYYGMRALLVGYLTKYLLLPGHIEHVLFYAPIKHFYELMSGPLDVQPFSSLIYGTYTGLIYATPLLGGWLADNFHRPARHRGNRHGADGLRPFRDGVGGAAVSRSDAAYLSAADCSRPTPRRKSGLAVCRRRQPPRWRLCHLLYRRQSWAPF